MSEIIIAIDGNSSCGKSTLAKALAKTFDYIHINTGSMYRATTLYFLEHNVDPNNMEEVDIALQNIKIHFEQKDGETHTFLNGKDVEDVITTMPINNHVSEVAKILAVREKMVQQQREMSIMKGIVMEGRDIGTVVFPDAEVKLFLTAEAAVRADRRFKELVEKEQDVTYDTVLQNLIKRDNIDSKRENSPLLAAEDAIVIDNTHLTERDQLEKAIAIVLVKKE